MYSPGFAASSGQVELRIAGSEVDTVGGVLLDRTSLFFINWSIPPKQQAQVIKRARGLVVCSPKGPPIGEETERSLPGLIAE